MTQLELAAKLHAVETSLDPGAKHLGAPNISDLESGRVEPPSLRAGAIEELTGGRTVGIPLEDWYRVPQTAAGARGEYMHVREAGA